MEYQNQDGHPALIKAYVANNDIWTFQFMFDHIVRIGDYVTCSCFKDLKCSAFSFTIKRIFPLDSTNFLRTENFIYPSTLPPICCPICLEESKWINRGIIFCFCKQCLQPFHKKCISKAVAKNHTLCPYCRTSLSSLSHVFSTDTVEPVVKEGNLEKVKSMEKIWIEEAEKIIWDRPKKKQNEQGKAMINNESFAYEIGKWTRKGNEDEDFFQREDDEDLPPINSEIIQQSFKSFEGFDVKSRLI